MRQFAVSLAVAAMASALSAQTPSPGLTEAMQRGAAAARAGNAADALAAYREAVTLAPRMAEAHLNLGLAELQTGQLEASAAEFRRAAELKPQLPGPHLFAGITAYRQGSFAEAEKTLRAESRLVPTNPDAWMWLGLAQIEQERGAEAVESLRKAEALKPKDESILYHLGRAYMLASRETYESMFRLDPNSWRVRQVLVDSYDQAGRTADAITEYRAAIAASPRQPGLHLSLGDMYLRSVQLADAEQAYRDELTIDPANQQAAVQLAAVLNEESKPAEAIRLLSGLIDANPANLKLRYELGRAEFAAGNTARAIAELTRVTSHEAEVDSSTLQQAYFYLSRAYRKAQQEPESRAALDKFVSLKQRNDEQARTDLKARMQRRQDSQAVPSDVGKPE